MSIMPRAPPLPACRCARPISSFSGNARGGTPLMQQSQTSGIDLPLKALVWQDEQGATRLSYNDPAYLAGRHGIGEPAKAAIVAMTAALRAIATKVTAP